MESQFPGLRQQSRTFNPEAASFNPTTPTLLSPSTEKSTARDSERLIEIPGHSYFAVSAAGASVQPSFASLFALANSRAPVQDSMFKRELSMCGSGIEETEPDLADSPFQTLGDMRSFPRGEQTLVLTPLRAGDVFSSRAYPPEDAEGSSLAGSPVAALTQLDRSDSSTATYHTAPTQKVKTSVASTEAQSSHNDTQTFLSLAEHASTPQQNDPCTDPATLQVLGARLGLPMESTTNTDSHPSFSGRKPPGFEHLTATESHQSLSKPPGLEHLEHSYLPSYLYLASSPPEHGAVISVPRSSTPPGPASSSRQVLSPHASNQPALQLYGKLIGRALDKPLTAKGLAQYLQGHANSSVIASPGSGSSDTVVAGRARQRSDTAETVRPPRSAFAPLGTQPASSAEYTLEISAVVPPKAAARSTSYQHRQRKSSDQHQPPPPPADYHQHVRRTSGRRNHRRQSSRIKRMDQGPMPSSADIYPDDASWTRAVPLPSYTTTTTTTTTIPTYNPTPQSYVPPIVTPEPTHWPTPAEVYRPRTPLALPPTTADIRAANPPVERLLAELPHPTPMTLAGLGVRPPSSTSISTSTSAPTSPLHLHLHLHLPSSPRALSPAQHTGARYGLQLAGLGHGDGWRFEGMGVGVPFRVRPREHAGWGGREWAVLRGWCE
jgi:hypothetical protein